MTLPIAGVTHTASKDAAPAGTARDGNTVDPAPGTLGRSPSTPSHTRLAPGAGSLSSLIREALVHLDRGNTLAAAATLAATLAEAEHHHAVMCETWDLLRELCTLKRPPPTLAVQAADRIHSLIGDRP